MSTAFISHPDCHRHDMGAGHPECPQRLGAIEDWLIAHGVDVALDRHEAPRAELKSLERAHSARYVAELKAELEALEQQAKAGVPNPMKALDPDTCANAFTWSATIRRSLPFCALSCCLTLRFSSGCVTPPTVPAAFCVPCGCCCGGLAPSVTTACFSGIE